MYNLSRLATDVYLTANGPIKMRLNLKSILERQLLPTRMECSPEHVCRLSELVTKQKLFENVKESVTKKCDGQRD